MSTQIATPRSVERNRKFRSWAIIIGTNLLSLICLALVLNNAQLDQIWGEVRHLNWRWVTVAIVSDVCVYLFHGLRWRLLLRPVQKVPFLKCLRAIYLGLFANETLPFRAGELIRCFLLSKSSEVPLSVTFASALIERIFDGVWLMACFAFCLHFGLPEVLRKGGYILAIIIVLLALVLAIAMYAKKQSLNLFFGMAWPRWFVTLIEDLHLIGHSRYLYFSFLVSGLYMLWQMLPIYAVVRAGNVPVLWTASFTMLVLLRLSSIVPQAPGNLGSFQWVASQTLIIFHVVAAPAKRFSLILWAVVTFPLIAIGVITLTLEGINLSHLHKEATSFARKPRSAASQ